MATPIQDSDEDELSDRLSVIGFDGYGHEALMDSDYEEEKYQTEGNEPSLESSI